MDTETMESERFRKKVGITYRQLDWWIRKGYIPIRDTDERHPGSGAPRDIPAQLVERTKVLAELVHAGVSVARADEIVDTLISRGSVKISRHLKVTRT